MWRWVTALFATASLALGGSACCGGGDQVVMAASWADAYPTIDEMVEAADVVVEVRVTGVADTGLIDSDVSSVPFTDFSARVTRILTGQADEEIIVRQTGGDVACDRYVVDGDPMLQPEADYVMFLTEFAPGQYLINGGPTGRLLLDGERLGQLPDSILDPVHVPADITALRALIG
ncbi:hypothetical protein [Occultella gossypii]|uniref:Uncharacterized protein n=1 Tax=Occultella gossypii TaxID=2800820 RepID=A0ABS7SDV9_9MICO|nr:hypothetical protein [Occultella gossypii]MBZ2198540.1 hypothetical protein [Occultella gossypii]